MIGVDMAVDALKSTEFKHTCDVYTEVSVVDPTTGIRKVESTLTHSGIACKFFQTSDKYADRASGKLRVRKNVLMIDLQNVKDNTRFTNFAGTGIDDGGMWYRVGQDTSVMPMTWLDVYGFTTIENLVREDNNA